MRQKNNYTPPKTVVPIYISKAKSIAPGISEGFVSNMMQGVALGSGSAIGHKAVDAVFSGFTENKKEDKHTNHSDCYIDRIDFEDCMRENHILNDCNDLYTKLNKCIKSKNSI
jgi:hypothetical protein